MSDNLTVFGVNYTGVTGIKAKGTGNGTLTYIRPTGTKSISANGTGIDVAQYASVDVAVSAGSNDFVVTLTLNSTTEMWEPDKTYAEIEAAYEAGKTIAVQTEDSSVLADGYYEGGTFYYGLFNELNFPIERQNYIYDSRGLSISDEYYIPTLQAKTAAPTTSQQVITPDSGYDGLSQVTVSAMPSGTAGTPTATKGTVSNHSVSVTPSVTNTTGYITGGTKNGTAVTVSASELVSGSETKTANGTYNVTNLASLVVDIPFVTYHTSSSAPASSQGSNGDIWLVTE